MRNISASLTTSQILCETKTVTRRLGWDFLKVGDKLQVCEKCQGLKKGEKLRKLKVIEVTHVHRECLENIRQSDVVAEGFADMTPQEFVAMFCKHMKCHAWTVVTRIEFKYVS